MLWTFFIIHKFIWQHFRLKRMVRMQHLMHIYLFGIAINRMLILQLKMFICKIYVFTLILYVILLLFLISML